MQAGGSGRSPASLASDNLEPVRVGRMRPNQQWLEDPVGADRLRQLLKSRRIDRRAGLERIGFQQIERNLPD